MSFPYFSMYIDSKKSRLLFSPSTVKKEKQTATCKSNLCEATTTFCQKTGTYTQQCGIWSTKLCTR